MFLSEVPLVGEAACGPNGAVAGGGTTGGAVLMTLR